MSKYSELAKTLEYRKVPIVSIQRHLKTIEIIADTMTAGPAWIESGSMNYSLTFNFPDHENPKRRIRFIFSRMDKGGEMLYLYKHAFRDQFTAIKNGEKPTAESIKSSFEWLYHEANVAAESVS